MEILKEEGNKLDLIDTILAYIENNGEVNIISKVLNIHRNTLNYRLERDIYAYRQKSKEVYRSFRIIHSLHTL